MATQRSAAVSAGSGGFRWAGRLISGSIERLLPIPCSSGGCSSGGRKPRQAGGSSSDSPGGVKLIDVGFAKEAAPIGLQNALGRTSENHTSLQRFGSAFLVAIPFQHRVDFG